MTDFRMPSLGADMEAGTILEWRVHPGDRVYRGDIVAVVDTEKSTIEVEVFADGIVDEIVVEPGVEVPVGTVLARIRTDKSEHRGPDRTFVRASPRARAEAHRLGVALDEVPGSGPQGAVTVADLVARPETPDEAPPSHIAEPVQAWAPASRTAAPQRDRGAGMRRAIGVLMGRSKREIPHYYLATTVDVHAAIEWLSEQNARRSVAERVLPAALLLKATALSVRTVPSMNGFWQDNAFREAPDVHLGVAVSIRGGGLVAPAVHDADKLSVDELMAAIRDLVQRARAGALRSSEMSDPTITVTNLGDQGVDEVFGVIYPPQVALVGFGKITDRPWAENGMVGARPVVRATLAADHRVSDGHDGARFLASIERLLQSPEAL
jgi:pyruvate dehydrogenase E2 component (dihydrolipoamide acetyltransferase)